MRSWAVVWVLGCVACGHKTPAAGSEPPAMVSPPDTLDEFRASFPVGTTLLMRYTVPDESTTEQRWTWVSSDAESCSIHVLLCDETGGLVEDQGEIPGVWSELHAEASFPADRTEQADASVDVPAGHFDTWLFTVQETAEDGTPQVERFHFDRHRPGPPVLYTIENDGTEVGRMELVEWESSLTSERCIPPPE